MVNKRAKARRNVPRDARRDFPFKDQQLQMYAKVTAMLGNGRVRATCDDGAERLCTIRGSMRRREWVHVGDTILVSLRTFDNSTDDDETPNPKPQTKTDKADVIFRYQESEVQQLRRFGEIDFENDTEDSDVVFEVDVENI